jgi:DNA sulfur modification protein DndE
LSGQITPPPRLETIRLSQEARERLIQLKRKTGVSNWNTLCRWGFCRSLAEPTAPAVVPVPADSSVEMSWKVFSGPLGDVFLLLLRERCRHDGLPLDDETLATQFRLHLHRGISYLQADRAISDIGALFSIALSRSTH